MRRKLSVITILGMALALLAAAGFSSRPVLAQLSSNPPGAAPGPAGSGPLSQGTGASAQGAVAPRQVIPAGSTATPTPTATCAGAYRVLIVYSDSSGALAALQTQILAEPGVIAVDLFDAITNTPTLAQLQQYTIVAPISNSPFADAVTLGNNLADYVDGGGVVVQLGFSHYSPNQAYGINGRWVTGNYNPYTYSTNLVSTAFTLGTYNAGHPLMQGVTMLNSNYQDVVTLAGGATQVAAASNGNSLVAYRPVGDHTTVGITADVGVVAAQSGHWGRVIVNAARWLAPSGCATSTPTSTPVGPSPTPTCGGSGTPGPWTAVSPEPSTAHGMGVGSDGTNIYAAGGISSGPINQFARLNPATGIWTSLTGMPDSVEAPSVVYALINNKVYVFGGYDNGGNRNFTRIYDVAGGTWSYGAAMPGTRNLMASGYYNGKIYLVGGFQTFFGSAQAQTWEYDPVANTWNTARANMPQAAAGAAYGIVNGHFYFISGNDGGTPYNNVYDYDIAANTWTSRANIPSGEYTPGSAVVNGRIWVFGGGQPFVNDRNALAAPAAITTATQIFDPATNTWSTGPNLSVGRNYLGGAGAGPYAVAVAGYTGSGDTSLTEISNNPSVPCATATGTPTNTPVPPTGTPTNTPMPPTSTPTDTPAPPTSTQTAMPTATGCALYFADVPATDPFFPFIRCLTCRALISGYDCGGPGEPCNPQNQPYFRGGNRATHGQVAKILSNAAGYADVYPTTRQTFADVPATNPFWVYSERIAARGFISGYNCGGPGEPCDPQNRPYFRWGNFVTRGQLSKMTAQTAGLSGTPTGQTFTDVPPNHPFYLWIEQLAGVGAITGYTCGGPGEPCDPQNRPYFRPYRDVTRGQTTKIIANAFFPNCVTPARP